MRLMSVCVRANSVPTIIVSAAMTYIIGRQSQRMPPNATYMTRMRAPNAATLVQAAMKPVTGVGAPW